MAGERLAAAVIDDVMAAWPQDLRPLVRAARARVLEIAPHLHEKVAFHALCYFRAGVPYGVIGGNVCLVVVKRGVLHLAFLHGAFLPDPQRILTGHAKSKRDLPIRSAEDLARPAVSDLIRAAVVYDPSRPDPATGAA